MVVSHRELRWRLGRQEAAAGQITGDRAAPGRQRRRSLRALATWTRTVARVPDASASTDPLPR